MTAVRLVKPLNLKPLSDMKLPPADSARNIDVLTKTLEKQLQQVHVTSSMAALPMRHTQVQVPVRKGSRLKEDFIRFI